MKVEILAEQSQAFRVTPDSLQPLVSEVVWFDYSTINSVYQAQPHLHHFHQLDVVLDGEFTLEGTEQINQRGKRGDAWVIPPLIWHGTNCEHPFRYCSFKFHLSSRFYKLFGTTFQRFRVPDHLLHGIDALGKRSTKPTALVAQQAAALIELCLIELTHQCSLNQNDDEELMEFRHLLWPLLEHIQNEPNIKWSVARMASELNLSPDYFSRCFHRIVGQPPQRYILETVMRASAAELLRIPAIPIKQIAERTGYSDVQAFTHAFTGTFKVSPAVYRRQTIHRSISRSAVRGKG